MKTNWQKIKLGDVLDYEQPTKYIVSSTNYSNDYVTPVLTAGKSFIRGYTNEKKNVFPANRLPVIIFDDFTTATQFVDFPFKVKSSAMKILHADEDRADVRYLFYLMQTLKLDHVTHKRYWISEYSKTTISLPPISEQKQIVAKLEKLLANVSEAKKLRTKAQEAASQLLPAELHKIFEEGKKKGWEEKELDSVVEITSSKRVYKNEYVEVGVPFFRTKEVSELDDGRRIKTELFISEEKFEEIRKKFGVPHKNDILLTAIGTIGKIYIVKDGDKFYFKDGNVLWLKSLKSVDPVFLKMFLRFAIQEMQELSSGSAYKALPINKLKKLVVPLPSLAEQKKIVARLDSISEKVKQLRAYQQSTSNELVSLEQSILNKAFSGEFI